MKCTRVGRTLSVVTNELRQGVKPRVFGDVVPFRRACRLYVEIQRIEISTVLLCSWGCSQRASDAVCARLASTYCKATTRSRFCCPLHHGLLVFLSSSSPYSFPFVWQRLSSPLRRRSGTALVSSSSVYSRILPGLSRDFKFPHHPHTLWIR